jgi:hypothetical protein
METYAALIAIDWADRQHAVCLYDQSTGRREQFTVKQTPECLQAWVSSLRTRFAGQKLAVCTEQSRGPLIYALLQYDFLVLYPINPTTLAKYRQAFSPSCGKDDPSDADYLLDLLQHHREPASLASDDEPTPHAATAGATAPPALDCDRTRISNRPALTERLFHGFWNGFPIFALC